MTGAVFRQLNLCEFRVHRVHLVQHVLNSVCWHLHVVSVESRRQHCGERIQGFSVETGEFIVIAPAEMKCVFREIVIWYRLLPSILLFGKDVLCKF